MQRLSFALMQALAQKKLAGEEPNTHIVDVRGTDEVQSTGMIPTAVNIPLDQLDAALKASAEDFQKSYNVAKPATSDRIVTYCLRGGRADKAAGIFTAAGYSTVDVYPGSWTEWSEKIKE